MPKMCVREIKTIVKVKMLRQQTADNRQSNSFASTQVEGMAALTPAWCPLETSGPSDLSHLALVHGAVEISQHSPGK